MSNKKNWIGRLVVELLIVFIGVYGAFELNRYQQTKRDHKIRHSYFRSFKSELIQLSVDIKSAKNLIDSSIEDFSNAINKGEKPNPQPLNIYFEGPMLITKAGFNDDVFVQLDPGLAASLSGGYDNVQLVSSMVKDFNDLCNDRLISNQPIQFYKGGVLKPEFQWYMEGLKRLQLHMNRLSGMISEGAIPATDELLADLEK